MTGLAAMGRSGFGQSGLLAIASAIAALALAYAFAPAEQGLEVRYNQIVCVDTAGVWYPVGGGVQYLAPGLDPSAYADRGPFPDPPVDSLESHLWWLWDNGWPDYVQTWYKYPFVPEDHDPVTMSVDIRTIADRSNPSGLILRVERPAFWGLCE